MTAADPDAQRNEILDRWELAAAGWGRRAGRVRDFGMPVSEWMVEHLEPRPGQRVLELAAGPGDTGFLAAELIRPGGILVSSDAAEAMLAVARGRAAELGIENVEFKRLELEWIDLSTASVDAVLCRWGFMLSVDPEAGLRETRRVLRPGGRLALAVWDLAECNPWATVPGQAFVGLGHAPPPDPSGPGMFALSDRDRLQGLIESAGFVEVLIESVEVGRTYETVEAFLEETLDLSFAFAEIFERLSDGQRAQVRHEISSLAQPFQHADGSLRLPGRSLVALADA